MEATVAEVSASAARRVFGVGVLLFLGLLLIRMAMLGGGRPLDALILVMALAALGGGWAMYRATSRSIRLRSDGLFDSRGICLARMEDIVSVDRGTFAFKPSNGFVLRTRGRQPTLWQPGLYWRYGRRIGVGGITRAAEAKQMADALAIMLAERSAAEGQG
ncbi:hypothetical protein ACRARG_02515 [Pseudooceanicola sp. C21-150M6]|uniref:hypothetical protein n=1 Tax=Pseudooceanicola sp. C21-150M6 TaxID=3434355 RepID=UPI003D7F9045